MRNRDTIMLEEAYAQIAQRRILSEEDTSKAADQLGDVLKKYKDKIAEVEELYKKASSPNATAEDLEAANKALSELNGQTPAPAAPAPTPTPAVTTTPQAPITAPDSQSAEEKAKSMMDASGNSPKVVAPIPQPAAAPVAPKPVSATPTPTPAPEQKAPAPAPTQPRQTAPKAPAAFVSPTANELTKFRKETGTNFNPSSRNDKLSMSLMRKGKPTLNTKQANAYRKANPNWTPETV